MKKNKTLAYALAATLLVGGTFAGTKALFTDQEIVENDLVLTTGTIDIEVKEEGWYRNNMGTGQLNEFEGVKPGDNFKKDITITNKSNIKNKIEVATESKENSKKDFVKVELKDKKAGTVLDNEGFEALIEGLDKGESVTVVYDVTIGSESNDTDNTYQEQQISLDELVSEYKINIEQK